jgi:hypothetical protein
VLLVPIRRLYLLRASCRVTAFTSYLELAKNYFELNCFENRTELFSYRLLLVFVLLVPSVFPINDGVWHAGEGSVVYCGEWRRGSHVTPPYCCAMQCLPRNPATHCAERSEGKQGAAALHCCCAIAFLEVSALQHLPHGANTQQYQNVLDVICDVTKGLHSGVKLEAFSRLL